jgi:hypothetical protein
MKALSIKQPWAWAILHAGKGYENRTWAIHDQIVLPTRIIIHASKKIDTEGLFWMQKELGIYPPANLPVGCLVGEVDIIACHDCELFGRPNSKWAFGPFAWELANPVAYAEPIPYKGQLGLFEVNI